MVTVAAMFFEEITVFCRSKQVKGLQDVCGCFSKTTAVPPANDLHTPPRANWEAEHPNLFSKQQFFGFHLGFRIYEFFVGESHFFRRQIHGRFTGRHAIG